MGVRCWHGLFVTWAHVQYAVTIICSHKRKYDRCLYCALCGARLARCLGNSLSGSRAAEAAGVQAGGRNVRRLPLKCPSVSDPSRVAGGCPGEFGEWRCGVGELLGGRVNAAACEAHGDLTSRLHGRRQERLPHKALSMSDQADQGVGRGPGGPPHKIEKEIRIVVPQAGL